MQYEHILAQQGGMGAGSMKIDPTMQPKFQEEWTRIESELISRYTEALEQHKANLTQRLRL